MRQAYTVLPVYAGDVSGACSALFELGGMVVIHDPSGCNSTYNTHDEVRWYDQDSLIFISGLTDTDAIMGNDEKFVSDVVQAAAETHPRFICLVSSPVAWQTGVDFEALCRLIEERSGISCYHVPTNGMHDYVFGASRAFELVAREMVSDVPERGSGDALARRADSNGAGCKAMRRPRVNVLGMTPLDFAAPGSRESLAAWLDAAGFELLSCWTMGSTPEEIARAGEADLDLVVSATGMRAAQVMEERFGMPYVAGLPVPAFSDRLARVLRQTLADGRDRLAWQNDGFSDAAPSPGSLKATQAGSTVLIGEPVCMESIAWVLRQEGRAARVVSPLEETSGLLGPGDQAVRGEEQITASLAGAMDIIGDPFYRAVAPGHAHFHPLPHLALSGRQWLREIPDLFRLDLADLMAATLEEDFL